MEKAIAGNPDPCFIGQSLIQFGFSSGFLLCCSFATIDRH